MISIAGAGAATAEELGLMVKLKGGDVLRLQYDTDHDRKMWLALLAPGLLAS